MDGCSVEGTIIKYKLNVKIVTLKLCRKFSYVALKSFPSPAVRPDRTPLPAGAACSLAVRRAHGARGALGRVRPAGRREKAVCISYPLEFPIPPRTPGAPRPAQSLSLGQAL